MGCKIGAILEREGNRSLRHQERNPAWTILILYPSCLDLRPVGLTYHYLEGGLVSPEIHQGDIRLERFAVLLI